MEACILLHKNEEAWFACNLRDIFEKIKWFFVCCGLHIIIEKIRLTLKMITVMSKSDILENFIIL